MFEKVMFQVIIKFPKIEEDINLGFLTEENTKELEYWSEKEEKNVMTISDFSSKAIIIKGLENKPLEKEVYFHTLNPKEKEVIIRSLVLKGAFDKIKVHVIKNEICQS